MLHLKVCVFVFDVIQVHRKKFSSNQHNLINEDTTCREKDFQGIKRYQIPFRWNNLMHSNQFDDQVAYTKLSMWW